MSQYDERVQGVGVARLACWVGAIVDALAGVQLLLPASARVLAFNGLRLPGAAGIPAVMAAVLMFGFTAVLLWAQMRVVKRRAVLFITLLVVIALASANLAFGISGDADWGDLIGPLVIQAGLIALFATAYSGMLRRRSVFGQRGRLQRLG